MSKPAARITDNHVCPMVSGLVPHVGGPILPPGCPTVYINGLPAARVSDMAFCAGGPDVIAMGSFTVLIAGMPAARMGDMTAHGGSIVLGSPNVMIGDAGGGAGSPAGATMSAARASGVAFTSTRCAAEAVREATDRTVPQAGTTEGETFSWIELELKDDDDQPVPFARYLVIPPDDRPREGFLDQHGFARVNGIPPGSCKIRFPDFDGRSWEPEGGGGAGTLGAPSSPSQVSAQPPGIQAGTVALRLLAGPGIEPSSVGLSVLHTPSIQADTVQLSRLTAPGIRPDTVRLTRR